MAEFKSAAVRLANTTGTADDASLVRIFKNSEAYKNVLTGLRRQGGSHLYTDTNMTQLLQAMLPIAVPQHTRSRYVDWAQSKAHISSVHDMLPAAFANISLRPSPETKTFTGTGRQLSASEIASLKQIIKNNPYAAQEFERVGLMHRRNGQAYFNPRATTEHVDALGGQIARMFEIGMRGARSSGITNIEEVQNVDRLKYRDNLYVNSARKMATELADAFPWMSPSHIVDVPTPKRPDKQWSAIGSFRAKPRQTTMEFLEFDASQ